MVGKVAKIKTIHLDSEIDALLLENKLIKEYQPKYNIQLKDDKIYPWIWYKNELFPRIFILEKNKRWIAFWTIPISKMVKTVIEMAKKCFEIRSCNHVLTKEKIEKGEFNTAVDFYIGNCKDVVKEK